MATAKLVLMTWSGWVWLIESAYDGYWTPYKYFLRARHR